MLKIVTGLLAPLGAGKTKYEFSFSSNQQLSKSTFIKTLSYSTSSVCIIHIFIFNSVRRKVHSNIKKGNLGQI